MLLIIARKVFISRVEVLRMFDAARLNAKNLVNKWLKEKGPNVPIVHARCTLHTFFDLPNLNWKYKFRYMLL